MRLEISSRKTDEVKEGSEDDRKGEKDIREAFASLVEKPVNDMTVLPPLLSIFVLAPLR